MGSDRDQVSDGDIPEPSDRTSASPAVSGSRTVLDLMVAVATCSLLFAAHGSLLNIARTGPERHLPNLATGMLLILATGHVGLTALRRRNHWRGLDESRDFVLVMILVVGLMASAFSWLATPFAGALYLAATLVILTYAMRRP
ncbi:hypothetical protein P12x_005823 [Tundrisphaera lichenicola]|uniref:hypothetical protein n=1 Tax=Tundrisphaera lichenicola TaxID=2029860 RepID=UPI003EBF2C71